MDFEKFYNEQTEYSSYRQNDEARKAYELGVNWKVTNLIDVIPENKKKEFNNILEVGCAFGYLLNEISVRLKVKNSVGLDISEENIHFGEKKYPHVKFVTGTTETVNLKEYIIGGSEKFDLVVLSDIVEHVPDDLDFMKKIASVSDFVIFNLPLEKSFMTRNRNYGETDPSGHLRSYNLEDGLKLINQSGFELINFKMINPFQTKEVYERFKVEQIKKIRNKILPKRWVWSTYYLIVLPAIIKIFPKLLKRIYGGNLLAFIKSQK